MADNRGPERLTKPEEISALSKYLKEIKDVQEEHTELGSDVLGLSGRDVGKIPELTELDSIILGLSLDENGKSKGIELPENNTRIPGGRKDIAEEYRKTSEREYVFTTPTEINNVPLVSDTVGFIKDPLGIKLSKEVEKLNDPRETQLNLKVVKGTMSPKDVELSDKVASLGDVITPDLSEKIEKISVPGDTKLPDDVLKLGNVTEPGLSDIVLGLDVPGDTKLPDNVLKLGNVTDPRLPNEVLELGDVPEPDLPNDILKLGEVGEPGLSDFVSKISGPRDLELDNTTIDLDGIRTLSEDDMYKKVLELLTGSESSEVEEKIASLFSTYLSTNSQRLTVDMVEEYERKLVEYARTRDAIVAREVSLVGDRELVPDYKLPNFSARWNGSDVIGTVKDLVADGGKIDVSSYLRWAVENTIGALPARGSTRQALIDETLAVLVLGRRELEVRTGSNRDKLPVNRNEGSLEYRLEDNIFSYSVEENALPGNTKGILSTIISGGLDDAVTQAWSLGKDKISEIIGKAKDKRKENRAAKLIGSTERISAPANRPDPDNEVGIGKTTFENGSIRVDQDEKLSGDLAPNLVNPVRIDFKENYLGGQGIKTTIEELTNGDIDYIDSVDGLIDILTASPYITTVGKFGSSSRNYNTLTLDGNGYWEIVIEPYVGPLNGYFSYLPAFREMDVWNLYQHGVLTYHNKWIPFTGFELQKSRMISKTLGLYDGEIAYPVSSELTNELRISIADDAYKSWRWYFQKCMDASVYSSEIHSSYYYTSPSEAEKKNITVVDKTTQLVAFYKNIAFNIKIYVMTPQYSTIRKFDLLCILREFSEEYIGEIDAAGAPDLSLSFSIVGEVPSVSKKAPSEMITYSTNKNNIIKDNTLEIEQGKLNNTMAQSVKAQLKASLPGKNGIITCGDLTMVNIESVREEKKKAAAANESSASTTSPTSTENQKGPLLPEYGGYSPYSTKEEIEKRQQQAFSGYGGRTSSTGGGNPAGKSSGGGVRGVDTVEV